jgi:hypothetical protein
MTTGSEERQKERQETREKIEVQKELIPEDIMFEVRKEKHEYLPVVGPQTCSLPI